MIPMGVIAFMVKCQPTRVVFVSHVTSVSNALLSAMCVIAALGSGNVLSDDAVAPSIAVVSILLSVTNAVRSAHSLWVLWIEVVLHNHLVA